MASGTGKYEIDMCSGPLLPKIIQFTLPLMFSGILQLLFNAADIIVVGKFAGDTALAAVGCTAALINLLTNLFTGVSVGANVLAARYYGARRQDELSQTVHTSMLTSLISGGMLTVVGLVGANVILGWMGTPDNVLELASLYLRIYFLGMPAMMIYNFGSSLLRAIGDTRRPLHYLSFAGALNVALNLLFVIVFKMSVAGVAWATVISQCISAGLVVRCLMKEQGGMHLDLKKLHIDNNKLQQLLAIGLPAGLQGVLFSLSNVIIQASINSFGDIAVAGNSAAANIEGFVWMAMNSFSQASMAFTGQNVGAGRQERVNRILIDSELLVFLTGLILGHGAFFFGKPLMSIYTDNPEVVEAGLQRMEVILRTYYLCGMMDVAVGALRGLGYSVMPTLVSLVGVCGLRLLWIFTAFQMPFFHNPTWLFITYPASWLLTFIVHTTCFVVIRKRQGMPGRN